MSHATLTKGIGTQAARVALATILMMAWLSTTPGSVYSAGDETTRVSVDSTGNQGNSFSATSSMSADGRFVAFKSAATNLAPNDTQMCGAVNRYNCFDIFVRDRQLGTTTRVSVDSAGNQATGTSQGPSMSADGRFVAFHSVATNLVPNDTNNTLDVFVRGPGRAVLPSPSTPDLAPGSDTGVSNSDNLTTDTTPTFTGTAPPNSTVTLLVDGAAKGTATATAGGSYSVTAGALTSGRHSVTATATVAGSTSAASGALNITLDTTPPNVTAPARTAYDAPKLGADTAPVPLKLSWCATGCSADIATYDLQQRKLTGTVWSARSTVITNATAKSAIRWLLPGTYGYQLRARDRAGNYSAFKPMASNVTITAYDEANTGISYTAGTGGTWSAPTALAGAYGGNVKSASAPGSKARVTFTGSSFWWVSDRYKDRGQANVYEVSGTTRTLLKTVELYAGSTAVQTRQVVFAANWTTAATRTIEIEVLSTKNSASTGRRVDVDAFVVIR